MSSWIFETYCKDNNYVEYRWDKGGTFAMFVGHKVNGLIVIDYQNTYATKERAKRAFQRQVRKMKEEQQ